MAEAETGADWEFQMERRASYARWLEALPDRNDIHRYRPDYLWEVGFNAGYRWANEKTPDEREPS